MSFLKLNRIGTKINCSMQKYNSGNSKIVGTKLIENKLR
jgi:hypothetical protein